MNIKQALSDFTLHELQHIVASEGQPAFRAKQLFAWITADASFEEMSNIPQDFLNRLASSYTARAVNIIKSQKAHDKSEKFLYKLNDNEIIEGVFLPNAYGNTLCISTQVGCRMGCVFCTSGAGGLQRNLSAGEIIGQFSAATQYIGKQTKTPSSSEKKKRTIGNVVYMGSGEPLDNYANTVKSVRLLSAEQGHNISPRNISISTCGLVPQIEQLALENLPVTLSLSLHATTDEQRKQVMPIAKKYSLEQTMKAMRHYFDKTKRRVCLEYVMIQDFNTSPEDAQRLARLAKGFPCHVNLIPLNIAKVSLFKNETLKKATSFLQSLEKLGVSASLRRSYGSEILGACGQLRGKYIQKGTHANG